MGKAEKLIIPKEDIVKLEEARLKVIKLLKNDTKILDLFFFTTPIMYKITHKKYPKVN